MYLKSMVCNRSRSGTGLILVKSCLKMATGLAASSRDAHALNQAVGLDR